MQKFIQIGITNPCKNLSNINNINEKNAKKNNMPVLIILFLFAFGNVYSADGKFFAFAGISGSGKSSLARELALLCQATSLHEQEENDWPECIRDVKEDNEFSSLTVYRAIRAHSLLKAQAMKENGQLVFVDSYYDKITAYYLGKPGMEWLIHPDDPYFNITKQMMELDIDHLPDADCIILIEVDLNDWLEMLRKRNRMRDNIEGFVESYKLYKSYVADAVEQLCKRRGIRLVKFNTHYSSPQEQAVKLLSLLVEQNILENQNATAQTRMERGRSGPIKEKISALK
jgi:thymidylate kinase